MVTKIKATQTAVAKLRIGTQGGSKVWMETFPSYTSLMEEVLERKKIEHEDPSIKFNKLYHGSADRLTIDQVNALFNGEEGFNTAMLHGDNKEWILITKE